MQPETAIFFTFVKRLKWTKSKFVKLYFLGLSQISPKCYLESLNQS